MIVVTSTSAMGNVIHLVVGPETELFVDVNGASVLDMGPILRGIDANVPTFLTLCRCRCEEETAAAIRECGEQGSDVPVKHNIALFGHSSGAKEDASTKLFGSVTKPEMPKRHAGHSSGVGLCSRCKSPGVELVPRLKPAICYACAQIDLNRTKPHDADSHA